jgi:hypothetical protein
MTVAESTPANITAASWHILAPEVFANDAALSIKSDVFQFAFVVWEMVQRTLTHTYRRAFSEYYICATSNFAALRALARRRPTRRRRRRPAAPSAAPSSAAAPASDDSAGLVLQRAPAARRSRAAASMLNDEIDRLGLRPTIPDRCPEPLQFVILRAWSKLAIDRPSAKDIAERFQDMIARFETDAALQAQWRAAIVPERAAQHMTEDAAAVAPPRRPPPCRRRRSTCRSTRSRCATCRASASPQNQRRVGDRRHGGQRRSSSSHRNDDGDDDE